MIYNHIVKKVPPTQKKKVLGSDMDPVSANNRIQ